MEFDPSRRLFLRKAGLVAAAPLIVAPSASLLEKAVRYFFAPSGGWSGEPNHFLTTEWISMETLRILRAQLVFRDTFGEHILAEEIAPMQIGLPPRNVRWLSVAEVAELKGKSIGDLTIDMEPRTGFQFYSSDQLRKHPV